MGVTGPFRQLCPADSTARKLHLFRPDDALSAPSLLVPLDTNAVPLFDQRELTAHSEAACDKQYVVWSRCVVLAIGYHRRHQQRWPPYPDP